VNTPRISVVIITFNEEKNIRDCLESISWVDEIIVVDSFSTDRTVEICREYTDQVIQREWPGHVRQKQFALEQATGDWILCLDADERLSKEATEEIRSSVLDGLQSVDGFILPRQSYYLGRWICHGGWYPDNKLRLVQRGQARWGGEDPHDKLMTNGKTKQLRGKILHYVYTNISHQLRTVDAFSRISAETWDRQGKYFNLFLLLFRPPIRFLETYIWKKGFLDGMPGFIIAIISSYYVFLKYAKLWELQKINPKDAIIKQI
jgi:glycosyltransferase involved in cell wall biosynthesis